MSCVRVPRGRVRPRRRECGAVGAVVADDTDRRLTMASAATYRRIQEYGSRPLTVREAQEIGIERFPLDLVARLDFYEHKRLTCRKVDLPAWTRVAWDLRGPC